MPLVLTVYLYIAIGDGGKAGDPLNAGQDLNSIFGKVIRIDVNQIPYGIPKSNPFYGQENKRGEIWAWGLRNPWRFSFDRENGDIYIMEMSAKINGKKSIMNQEQAKVE